MVTIETVKVVNGKVVRVKEIVKDKKKEKEFKSLLKTVKEKAAKIDRKKGLKFPKLRKFKPTGIRIPSISKISEAQLSKTLQSRRERTAQRVLDSNASPIAKAKARIILGV